MIPIIAITGTKGKTSSVRLIDKIFLGLGHKTLRTDTQGVYKNNKMFINKTQSKQIYGLSSSTKCPGRFLANLKSKKYIGIFEESIGCYETGLGYSKHKIALFTNVYADHLGRNYLKTIEDIAIAKGKFLLDNVENNGYVVFNSDDKLVEAEIKKRKTYNIIGFGKNKKNIKYFFHINGNFINLYKNGKKIHSYDTNKSYIGFGVGFEPSLYNIAGSLGVILAFLGEQEFIIKLEKIKKIINKFKPDTSGQRLIFGKVLNTNYVIDFAHEEISFKYLGELLNKLFIGKKTIFIRSLFRNSSDKYGIRGKEIGYSIGKHFDNIYIYGTKEILENPEYEKYFLKGFKEGLNFYKKKFIITTELEKELNKSLVNGSNNDIIGIITNDQVNDQIMKILN